MRASIDFPLWLLSLPPTAVTIRRPPLRDEGETASFRRRVLYSLAGDIRQHSLTISARETTVDVTCDTAASLATGPGWLLASARILYREYHRFFFIGKIDRNSSGVELRTLDYENPASNPVLRC